MSSGKWLTPSRRKRLCSENEDGGGSKLNVVQNPEIKFLDVGSNEFMKQNEHRKTSLFECGGGGGGAGATGPTINKYSSDLSYMTHTAGTGTKGLGLMHGKMNLMKVDENYANRTWDLFKKTNDENLLNETSLGDFLRALTSLHNRVGPRQNYDEWNNPTPSPPPPPPQSHSLIDLSPTSETIPARLNTFTQSSLNRTESMPIPVEKEPYNLKKLGRFLLRSYSSKSESNPDVSYTQTDDDNVVIPSVRIEISSPPETEEFSQPPEVITRSNTLDSTMKLKRRQSINVFGNNPFRSAASTESVYHSIGSKGWPPSSSSSPLRQSSIRWRTGGKAQGETCSSKPSLSNVKEVNNN